MSSTIPIETLRTIPLFQSLTDDECQQIVAAATVIQFDTGEVILRQGKISQNLWIVLDGCCEVLKQLPGRIAEEEVILAEASQFSTFGEMSFFHSAPHSASVRAKTPVKLLRLERSRYDQLIASGSQAAFKLALNTVGTLAEWLRRMDDWVVELLARTSKTERTPEWLEFRKKLFGNPETA